MVDWQDYAFTMVVTTPEQTEKEFSSDSLMFLVNLGEAGLETNRYESVTIHSNKGATHEYTHSS